MADLDYEIIHQHYADATAAISGMNDQNWAYEEAGKRLMVMDGATPRYYFDADYIEANFIQNQDSSDQTSSLRISGDGTFGGDVNLDGDLNAPTGTGYFESVNSSTVITNNTGIFSGLSRDFTASSILPYVSSAQAYWSKNDSNTMENSVYYALAKLTAGASNANDTVNLFFGDTTNTSVTGLTVNLMKLAYGGATKFLVSSDGVTTIAEAGSAPANPTAGTECRIYMRGDRFVIQFNDGGTTRYKYLDLTGTGVTWTHTTTAP